jgi:hypothetical protein
LLGSSKAEAAVAGELARRGEALDRTDLGRERVGEHPADAGHGQQQRHVAVLGAQAAQLGLAGGDLPLELVDQAQARPQRARPGLGQRQPLQQPAPGQAEEVGDRAGLAVCEQERVHALLEAGAMADEVEPETGPLPLGGTLGSGSQSAGTSSRRQSSASTQASIRSVLQASEASRQRAQTVCVRRGGTGCERGALLVEQVVVEALAAEV